MELLIRPASGAADVRLLASLADEIWREHFTPLIGKAQVDYMLDRFQDEEAMTAQMAEGMLYLLAYDGARPVGYCASRREPERIFLSKLYVRRDSRGRGIARALLEAACTRGEPRPAVYLTVNKHNDGPIAAYRAMGFTVIDETVTDIGSGFVMDDYIMEKKL